MRPLADWIAGQRRHAAAMMRQSISPASVKARPHFFQTIIPRPGAVVASPVLAAYDPEPDYFFHWYRDSALTMEALWFVRDEIPDAETLFDDFLHFSRELAALDGRLLPPLQAQPAFTQFLRRDVQGAHGAAIAGETRVNADGTLDVSDWPRPQYDGPALRALTLMRWGGARIASLLRADLEFVLRHARQPCFGVWEEEMGLHYYGRRVSAAALAQGAAWLLARGESDFAARCRKEADAILHDLEDWWLPAERFIRAHKLQTRRAEKELDVSVILAANHAGAAPDDRLMATLAKLETLFGALYPINQGRSAPAMGRYGDDAYYGGGAWYAATLAAAELCYRAGDVARGDGFLETVRAFTPESGDMSEQFDRNTGTQTSARHLAWSYAAFITAIQARAAASG